MWPYRRQPTRLLCPWDSPGKNTGVGCRFLSTNSLQIGNWCMICISNFHLTTVSIWLDKIPLSKHSSGRKSLLNSLNRGLPKVMLTCNFLSLDSKQTLVGVTEFGRMENRKGGGKLGMENLRWVWGAVSNWRALLLFRGRVGKAYSSQRVLLLFSPSVVSDSLWPHGL